ncbi:hypothetical protein V1264_018265 [Littorina saxatilis]|uniref:Uncharacterized protein n=1 Tax=Littorina saxatilis TaxID=31220 RepID=A0AAN9BC59_9CAEN
MQHSTFPTSRLPRALNPFGMSRVLGEDWGRVADDNFDKSADDNFDSGELASKMDKIVANNFKDADATSNDSLSPSSFADETRISVDDNDNNFIHSKRDAVTELNFTNSQRTLGFHPGHHNGRNGVYDDPYSREKPFSDCDVERNFKERAKFEAERNETLGQIDADDDDDDDDGLDEAIDMTVNGTGNQVDFVSMESVL